NTINSKQIQAKFYDLSLVERENCLLKTPVGGGEKKPACSVCVLTRFKCKKHFKGSLERDLHSVCFDQSLSANLGSAPPPEKLTAEVTFDAGSEFNLSFFDTPEDNSTQGFSDPGSVGSTSASSPPPQLPLPQVINSPSTILLQPLSGASNPGTAAASTTLGVKQGASTSWDTLSVE
ncbi:hypothetical protein L9F63_026021, partial [Diploptera punctata]